mmetsp:Transcript_66378/g.163545  ORF Transcript_66378/g.163545 Transcript_66378/m.163545 type:complete len:293 (-) Transcript_66378:8453-9331(-)
MMVPVDCDALASTAAETEMPVTANPEELLVRRTDVGSLACLKTSAAACAGVRVETELGSGRITKTTMMDPPLISSTVTRKLGIPSARATSSATETLNCSWRAGDARSSAMSPANVISTSTGASISFTCPSVTIDVFCLPPEKKSRPTEMTRLPSIMTPARGTSVHSRLVSAFSTIGEHGTSPVAVRSAPETSATCRPKFWPVTVSVTVAPRSIFWGATVEITGGGKLTKLVPTLYFSMLPLLNRTIRSCCRPTHAGVTHVSRVPALSSTTRELHSLERVRSTPWRSARIFPI